MEDVRILGLDPGLQNTGWYVLEGNLKTGFIAPPVHFGVIKTQKWVDRSKTAGFSNRERIDLISGDLQKMIIQHGITHVAVEDFVFMGRVGATSEQMVSLVEHIRLLCRFMNIPCEIYTNGFWKTVLMKCHTANKNQVSHYITRALRLDREYLGRIDPGNHIRDAIAIAYCRFKFLRGAEENAEHGDRSNSAGSAVSTDKGRRGQGNPRRNASAGKQLRRKG